MVQRPAVLELGPSLVGMVLGGLVGTALFVSFMYAAPVAGVASIDVLRTIGGVFTSGAAVALAVGFVIASLFGMIVWPSGIMLAWTHLPGGHVSMVGAIVKGITSGVLLWILFGMALGIGHALNRLGGGALPGAFALNLGMSSAAWLLAGSLLYGLAVAVVGGMENSISPIDVLGWKDFHHAASGMREFGAHR
jgi:hypothetical protein